MKYKAICPPEWLSRSAVYQINPRTFSREGTIKAVTDELPKLKDLGFRVMYLCPIFEEDDSENREFWSTRQKKSETNNPKNPYRMNNYFRIDSEYGTENDLREFIEEAHRLGMRVLLDLVYLHMARTRRYLKGTLNLQGRTGTEILFARNGISRILIILRTDFASIFGAI